MKPEISVVICIYNGEKTLEASITSLINQDYSKDKYEIILMDDGSNDHCSKICERIIEERKKQLPIIKYGYQSNKGLAIARNVGISLSSGNIVAFIDQDAVAKSDWLTQLIKPFLYNGADIVGGKVELLNKNSRVAVFSQITKHVQSFKSGQYYNTFVGCNMAFKKSIFYESGGFYKNFTSLGDESSLLERIKDHYKYIPVSDAVVYHERSEKLSEFINTEWRVAILNGLTRKDFSRKLVLKFIYTMIEDILIILVPLMLVVADDIYIPLILLVSFFVFIRRLFIRPISRLIFSNLKLHYGILKGLGAHILYLYCSSILTLTGLIIGYFKYYNIDLIPSRINNNVKIENYKSNE